MADDPRLSAGLCIQEVGSRTQAKPVLWTFAGNDKAGMSIARWPRQATLSEIRTMRD